MKLTVLHFLSLWQTPGSSNLWKRMLFCLVVSEVHGVSQLERHGRMENGSTQFREPMAVTCLHHMLERKQRLGVLKPTDSHLGPCFGQLGLTFKRVHVTEDSTKNWGSKHKSVGPFKIQTVILPLHFFTAVTQMFLWGDPGFLLFSS